MPSRLVVMRHAKSDYPWGVADHDRPLNERGRRDAPAAGEWLDAHVAWVDGAAPVVLVSTARRAQLTWALARARLSDRWESVDVRDESAIYEASVPALRTSVGTAAATTDDVVLVGHNPGLADLVHILGAPSALRDEATLKFPTSAIAVLVSDRRLSDAITRDGAFTVSAFAVPRG